MKTKQTRWQNAALAAVALVVAGLPVAAVEATSGTAGQNPPAVPRKMANNRPFMMEADGRLRFDFGEERMVLEGGLQPFLLCTASGALVVQVQSPDKPVDTPRIHYAYAMATVVSRDGGRNWTPIPLKPGENGLNSEGGAVQLRDGTILGLDTYITPGAKEGEGMGQRYTSKDDWRTLQGPEDIAFDLPQASFHGSMNDGGKPSVNQRLHRRIVELPNGDLLTTYYGRQYGDKATTTYMPSRIRSRVVLIRSTDRGKHWKLISTVAVDPKVGTEGYNEPVLARVSGGSHPGRLICLMRTGRELQEAVSDDEGVTWSKPKPRVFAGLDIYRTELWVDMFREVKRQGKFIDENNPEELRGVVVDPDLIELRSGLLVAAFGVRVPQKGCFPNAYHPWNGNYLAVSRDHGETWSNVICLTSGVLTTHYMGVEETATDNELFVVYDHGAWAQKEERYTYGRSVKITAKP